MTNPFKPSWLWTAIGWLAIIGLVALAIGGIVAVVWWLGHMRLLS